MKTLFNRPKQPVEKPTKWVLLEVEPGSDLDEFLSDLLQDPRSGIISSGQHQGGTLSDALFAFAKAANATPWLHMRLTSFHGKGILIGEED